MSLLEFQDALLCILDSDTKIKTQFRILHDTNALVVCAEFRCDLIINQYSSIMSHTGKLCLGEF